MKKLFFSAAFVSLFVFFPAYADSHDGVQNPVVQKRMEAMKSIGGNMKMLGQMAKGELAFDQEKAVGATKEIADIAARVPALFEAEEDDPKSEAKDEIWFMFEDFVEKSKALEDTAIKVSGEITKAADVPGAMKQLGATCKACHSTYKE